jgi:hypothetical protein
MRDGGRLLAIANVLPESKLRYTMNHPSASNMMEAKKKVVSA